MQTPELDVVELRAAMASASEPVRRRFAIEPNGNWQIPIALFSGSSARRCRRRAGER